MMQLFAIQRDSDRIPSPAALNSNHAAVGDRELSNPAQPVPMKAWLRQAHPDIQERGMGERGRPFPSPFMWCPHGIAKLRDVHAHY